MNKKTSIITTLMAAMLLTACNALESDQDDSRIPIRLTTSIAQTRSVTPTQETVIATGQNIYVWANEEATPGTADWTQNAYLSAWRLTKGDTPEWSSQSSQPYYPSRSMSMVALHGNFQPAVVEERTEVPATITHQVKTDQRQLADYAASDLLYWNQNGINAVSNNPIAIQFAHKLSKIEIELVSAELSATDLADAIVTLNGLQTSTVLTVTDATPSNMGTIAAASGAAQTILPYAAAGNQREAIIPPQANSGISFSITFNGVTTTVIPTIPADDFVGNTRYTYTLNINKTGITMTTSISPWESGSTTSNPVGIQRNIKMNPLWYVSKSNLNEDGKSFSTINNISQGYLFSWQNSMNLGYTYNTEHYNGYNTPSIPKTVFNGESGATWHIPTRMEWLSILPATFFTNDESGGFYDIFSGNLVAGGSSIPAGTVFTEPACTFGYNDDTKYGNGNTTNPATPTGTSYKSYWSAYTENSNVRYAIRFLGTDYCSVWKYQNLDVNSTNARIVISSRLIDPISDTDTDRLSAMMATITNDNYDWSEDEGRGAVQRSFYWCGFANNEQNAPGGNNRGHYWSTTLSKINTEPSRSYWGMCFQSGFLTVYPNNGNMYTRSVRLFRDNPEHNVMMNPLWYMAEYNVANANGDQFASAYNQAYYFKWTDAMAKFSANRTAVSYDGYKVAKLSMKDSGGNAVSGTWHWPTRSEWLSVIPGAVSPINDYAYDETTGYYFYPNFATVNFGYNYETKTTGVVDNMFIRKVSEDNVNYLSAEFHAIRYLGTPYCSAWKYVFDTDKWIISATLIDPVENNENSVKWFYENKWSSIYFGNDASKGAVQRVIWAGGCLSAAGGGTGSSGNVNVGKGGYYGCATENGSDRYYYLRFGLCYGCWISNDINIEKGNGTPIRLFLDN